MKDTQTTCPSGGLPPEMDVKSKVIAELSQESRKRNFYGDFVQSSAARGQRVNTSVSAYHQRRPFAGFSKSLLVSSIVLIALSAVPVIEGQQCDGTETFEKISNAVLRAGTQIPLYSSAGNTVTAECNNRCRSSDNCPAFLVNYDTETCFRLDTNSEGRRNDLVPAPLKVNYFEKICLQAPSCDRAWMFERVVGYELKGFDDMIINEVPTKTRCEELCVRETGIQCRSAEYDYVLRQCRLSQEDRRTQPAFFQPSADGNVDYFENQCHGHPPNYHCDYEAIEGMDLGRGDLQVASQTLDQCRQMCDATTVFNCRSFTFFSLTKMCHLSGDDVVSAGQNSLVSEKGAMFYQKSPCLDLSLTCTADSMQVHLHTAEAFSGRIYSQEHPTGPCEVFGSGAHKTEISFGLRNSGCGVAEEDKGVYTNVIVVQHHPVIQRRGDKAVKLYCLFETTNKTVTSSLALAPEVAPGAVATAIVNATAPSPSIRLRITDAEGRDIVGAKLGERIYLRVEIDDDSIFGIFARSLVAKSGSKSDAFELLDARGCPTDSAIFPAMQKLDNTKSLVAPFEAFKFTSDSVVRFQVNIQFCLPDCAPARCGTTETYGRRRRRSASAIQRPSQHALYSPASSMDDFLDEEDRMYMNSLDEEDQEVLFHETPLQKEIIVDGAAVTSVEPDEADRQVTLSETTEMICTTKSVVVASILSTAALQVCILIVCLLCIHVHRRKKSIDDDEDSGMGLRLRGHRKQHPNSHQAVMTTLRRRQSMSGGSPSIVTSPVNLAPSASSSGGAGLATSINLTGNGLEINYGSNSSAAGLVVPCAAFSTANSSIARRTALDNLPLRTPSFRD